MIRYLLPVFLILLLLTVSCSRIKEQYTATHRTPKFRNYKQVEFDHDVRGVREIQVYDQPRRPEEVPVLRDTLSGWEGQSFAITIDQEIASGIVTDSLKTRRDCIVKLFVIKYYPILYHVSIDHGGNEIHTISFTTTDLVRACWQNMEPMVHRTPPIKEIREFTEEGIAFRDIVLLPELANGIHPMILRYNPNHWDMLLAGISDKGVHWCISMHSYEPEKKIQVTLSHSALLLEGFIVNMDGTVTDAANVPGSLYAGGIALHNELMLWYDADDEYAIRPEDRPKSLTRYRILDTRGTLLDSFAVNAKRSRYLETAEYCWYDSSRKVVYLITQSLDSLYAYQNAVDPHLKGYAKQEFMFGAPQRGPGETEIKFFPKQKFRSYVHTESGKVRIAF